MAKFTLNIEPDDIHELVEIVDKLAGSPRPPGVASLTPAPEPAIETTGEPATEAPKARRGRPPKETPAPQTVAGFAAEVEQAAGEPAAAEATAPSSAPASTPASSATPSASGQTATTSASPSEPAKAPGATYEDCKASLVKLMGLTSGNHAREVLQATFGPQAGSLSALAPSQYGEAKVALDAAIEKAGG